MENNNTNYNNNEETSKVSTYVTNYSNPIGTSDATAIKVDFWSDLVVITFAKELSDKSPTKRWDWKNGLKKYIRKEKCIMFSNLIKEYMLPVLNSHDGKTSELNFKALSNGEHITSVGVPINSTDMINFNLLDENNKLSPRLELHINLDGESMIPDFTETYIFNKSNEILNYNNKTGKFDTKVTYTEIYDFLTVLTSFVESDTKAFVHAARQVDNAYKNMTQDKLNKLGTALNIDLETKPTYGTGSAKKGDVFNKNKDYNANKEVTTSDDLSKALDDNLSDEDLPF